jgi:hypothetical protein
MFRNSNCEMIAEIAENIGVSGSTGSFADERCALEHLQVIAELLGVRISPG